MRTIKCHFCGKRLKHECDPDIKLFANKDLQIANHPALCGCQHIDNKFTPDDVIEILKEQKKEWTEKIKKLNTIYIGNHPSGIVAGQYILLDDVISMLEEKE